MYDAEAEDVEFTELDEEEPVKCKKKPLRTPEARCVL